MSEATKKKFSAKEHLRTFERRQRQLDGSYKTVGVDYLDVKWRLVWLREEQPDATIITDLLSVPGTSPAVVKATVTLGDGTVATGFGQIAEDKWGDYLEKAETRAIGRALGLLGFGTQFTDDFDEVVTDAPVESKRQPKRNSQPKANGRSNAPQPMTPRQQTFIGQLGANLGLADSALDWIAEQRFDHSDWTQLGKQQASDLIDVLQDDNFDADEAKAASRESPDAPAEGEGGDDQFDPSDEGITQAQINAVANLSDKQKMDGLALIAYAAGLVEREITSIVELTEEEGRTLIKALQSL